MWLSEALLPFPPPFSFRVFTFEGCFPSSAGKHRKVAIAICKDVTYTGERLQSLPVLGSYIHIVSQVMTFFIFANTYLSTRNSLIKTHLKDSDFHSRCMVFDDGIETFSMILYDLCNFRIEVCTSLVRSKHKISQILRLVGFFISYIEPWKVVCYPLKKP